MVAPRPDDFRFRHRLRVRWSEVDAQQVVFNGHYLNYLDVAMGDFWRAVGLPYPEAFHSGGGDVFVRRNALDYHAPARLDDWLDIGVRCDRLGNTSLTMAWAAWCGGRLLVSGEVVYVHTSLESGRPAPLPASVRSQLQAWALDTPVHHLACGSWSVLRAGAEAVRTAVFVQEQGIAPADEWDHDDAQALHAVVSNLAGLPLATGRLVQGTATGGGTQARIGRMAVLRSSRGIGLATQVLQALVAAAREAGHRSVGLHAQLAAMPLYAKAGFVPVGEVFDEVGIAHQAMVLHLKA